MYHCQLQVLFTIQDPKMKEEKSGMLTLSLERICSKFLIVNSTASIYLDIKFAQSLHLAH